MKHIYASRSSNTFDRESQLPSRFRKAFGVKNPFSKEKEIFSSFFKILLCLLIICAYYRVAHAAHVGKPSINGTGVDKYGAYVEFNIPIRSQSGSHAAGYIQGVTTGNLYFNKNLIATFSESSDSWDNSDVNITVNSGYGTVVSGSSLSQILSASAGNKTVSGGSSGEATITLRWYVTQSNFGMLNFSSHEYVTGYYVTLPQSDDGALRDQGTQYWSGNSTVSNFIPSPSFSFSPSKDPGEMSLSYSYNSTIGASGASSSYAITHWVFANNNTKKNTIQDQTNNKPSGSLDVDMGSSQTEHNFFTKVVCEGGFLTYQLTTPVTVPAYVWPASLTATYDNKDSVKLEWTVNTSNLGSDYVDNDNFEVQRCTDPSFATNVSTVANYAYKSSQSDYTIHDDLSDIKGGTHVYYRLRRTKSSSDWNWKESRNTDLEVNTNSTIVADTAVLDDSGNKPTAIISWQPFKGVWVNGTKFSIKKINNTTGAVAGTFDLTEDQARSGKYVDDNITYCNEFSYSIICKLGNGYTSPPEKQVPGSVLAVNIGTISGLTVSKGYYPDRVELHWKTQGIFDNYIIKRKVYGSSDPFVQIASIGGSSTSDLQAEDDKGTPGVYYEYMVLGAVSCNNSPHYSQDTLYAVGFRSPTGNIYGRVTYSNGQAVENAAVRLENQDNNQLGQSVYLNGNAKSYLMLETLHTDFADSALTTEAWIKPDDASPQNQVIFSRGGQYELGFDGNGKLYFSYNGKKVTGNYSNPNQSFIHVAGIHTKDSLSIMLNDSLIASIADPYSAASGVDSSVYIGANASGNNFKGYIDEMLVWNLALGKERIAKDYTRFMTGGEKGLIAYWRFDETIANQFYDLSHNSDRYNQNDGIMDASFVKHTNVTPSTDYLSFKAYTDSTGNYMIAGIPYTGVNGTTYKIIPLLGTHQFDPVSVNRLISASTSEFTVDFTDNSSFPLEGYIYYRNSTVPVEGVQFKIDGKYAQQSNGDLIQTDASGEFNIFVPVGAHQVQAVKNNHVFVNDGLITDRFGNNLNYQGPIRQRILYDSTTIRFIGRVAGGAVQEAYPLGHSLSVNNLGKNLKIVMKLTSGDKYNLRKGEDSSVIVDHLLPSNQTDSSSIHKTKVIWKQNEIDIYPDSLTGEFETDIIPEKFIINQVNATGWGDLLEGKAKSIDFTNQYIDNYSIYGYEDSTRTAGDTTWTYHTYKDSVAYNDSLKIIKRVSPTVEITQLDNSGKEVNYFGDTAYQYHTLAGNTEIYPLIKPAKSGRSKYLFGYPVFTQGVDYHFKIKAYEEYPFYQSVKPDGTKVIATKDGKPMIDEVPTQDGTASVYDNIKNGSVAPATLSLDSTGVTYYNFAAGEPVIIAPGLKTFATTIKFGQATNVNWLWNGNNQMQAFVMGSKQTGTDFVTAGPNKLLMVLRDPPGNRSYSYIESGSTFSSSSTYSGSVDQVGDEKFITDVGAELVTWAGVGVGTINTVEATSGVTIGIHHEEHYTGERTVAKSTTLTTAVKTSDDPTFVGAPADVFVGYSTNITYGESENLLVINKDKLQGNDTRIDSSGDKYVVMRNGINFGQKFGTLFAYPQQHITKILIPNLGKIRNSLLLPKSTSASEAQQAANINKEEIYVSKLDPDDPNFGKSNDDTLSFGSAARTSDFDDGPSYKIYFPKNTKYRTDTIMTINQYIADWKKKLADNEKQKLNAKLLQNYSFHAGTPIDYSEQTTSTRDTSNSFNIVLSGSVLNSTEIKVDKAGVEFEVNESLGTTQGGTFTGSTDTTTTQGFELAADGTDEYLSVDVNNTDDGGFSFRTKGGVSGCPYEDGTVTQYYQAGTQLNQPTEQIEVPKIKADHAVENNVPSTQKASFTLSLSNESDAKYPATFVLSYGNTDSIKGATIAVDGASLAGGRAFDVQYGQTVTKVLTITKGPDAMDYNNIPIILHSGCQYDPTGYQALIADTVLLSAHFVPSCSNINVKEPTDNWILNTMSPTNQQGKCYVPITLDQFDESNNLFDHIELQYKPSASSQWVTAMSFYGDSTKYKAAQGQKAFITNPQEIDYDLQMGDAAFNDQRYDVRAMAVCQLGPGNFITTPSKVVSGMKDTYTPRLFGSPQPADGILGINNDIRLNFNESIAGGLLTPSDFQITGIRNGAQTDHSVSVSLDGQSDYLTTEFSKNLAGKDITVEMWVLPDAKEDATLFSQGNVNESMEMGFTADNHLQVIIGGKEILSDKPLDYKRGQWAHVALIYSAQDGTVSADYDFQEVIHQVAVGDYSGKGPFEFGRSISQQGNYFAGKMHEVRVWTKDLTSVSLQENSLKKLSGSENDLLAYYPMNEGKGNTVFDKAHGNNASLTGNWSTPPGKAVAFNGNGYVKVSTGNSPITKDMDYTIGLWFKAQAGQADAALVDNGKGDGADPDSSRTEFYLGFENGLLTFENNGFKVQAPGNYLDNQWHQVDIAVNRNSGVAQLFVDGNLEKYFDAGSLGSMEAPYAYLGARAWYDQNNAATPHIDRYFKGNIDEFRIWNTYLDQELIKDKSNTRLNGDELGLLAYYPFEKYFEFQNNKEMGFTLADQKTQDDPNVQVPDAVAVNAVETDDMAPIKDRGPVDNLQFNYVVNNDALIINMEEPKQAIDRTIVTLQAKNVKDEHGNTLVSPVTWTAFIDQNPLKWGDQELNLSKAVDSSLQFQSYIVNSGGNVQHFTLDNLPAWLSAEPSSGTVDPEGKQMVTFTVNRGLNIGNYNEIVYLRNDNDENSSLAINLKVNGKKPDWKVNPADFKYNMTVYGKIRINNIFSSDSEDLLAAFADGKCIGVTNNTYNSSRDLWYAFLTMYSDSIQKKNVEFRIWNASDGKIYEATPSQTVNFVSDGIVGTSSNPVIFDGKEMLFQDIELNKGWNWISFNLANPNLRDVSSILANGNWQSGDIVKNEESGFDQYSFTQGWVGYMSGFNNSSLFMLKTANEQTLSASGTTIDVKKMPLLIKGNRWNYISYLPQVNLTVKEALAGYRANEADVIKSQEGFAMYDPQNGWIGNLEYLEPGKGYMLYRKDQSDDTLYYPSISGSLNIHREARNVFGEGRLNAQEMPVAGNYDFAENMTVVARVIKGAGLQQDDEIYAYVDGELRGKAKMLSGSKADSLFFFNIGGESQQAVQFALVRNGVEIARSSQPVKYSSNSMLGTLDAPYQISFEKAGLGANAGGVKIYPNPFSDQVEVQINLGGAQVSAAHKVKVAVYDVSGRTILEKPEVTINGGYYQMLWNGKDKNGADCKPGIYFINVDIDGSFMIYKVVKQ